MIKVPGIAVVKQPCTHELRPELQRTTGPEPQPLQHRSGTSPAQLAPEPQVVHRPELSPELQLRTGRSGTSATPESVPELHLPQVGPELQVDASGTSSAAQPVCAAAQVNVDFLDGQEWARSTSNSRADFGIFDMLFNLVEVGQLLTRCGVRLRISETLFRL
jgi:hypothetical protein